jgi:hypothetical protein
MLLLFVVFRVTTVAFDAACAASVAIRDGEGRAVLARFQPVKPLATAIPISTGRRTRSGFWAHGRGRRSAMRSWMQCGRLEQRRAARGMRECGGEALSGAETWSTRASEADASRLGAPPPHAEKRNSSQNRRSARLNLNGRRLNARHKWCTPTRPIKYDATFVYGFSVSFRTRGRYGRQEKGSRRRLGERYKSD